MKIIISVIIFVCGIGLQDATSQVRLHSHNDYLNNAPFWDAWSNELMSIEIDLHYKRDTLFVAHTDKEISSGNTFKSLYINPLQQVLKRQNGKPYLSGKPLIFMIDIKTDPIQGIKALEKAIAPYKNIFDTHNNSNAVQLLICLNVSNHRIKDYQLTDYPPYFKYDVNLSNNFTKDVLPKVGMVSLNFANYSVWNGKGRLTKEDKFAVEEVVNKVHEMGKPIRFWGCPDGPTTWEAFTELGVDFINTDKPNEASRYIETLSDRMYASKTSHYIYHPTFKYNKNVKKIKNVILMIGDGMGLAQMASGLYGSGGDLTISQLKHIGLVRTQSADDFTTDSAAGGTAMATGVKTNNRYIGVDVHSQPVENIIETLSKNGFKTGIVTSDEINGASPSAFYAHTDERDDSKTIFNDLKKSDVDLFVARGVGLKKHFNLDDVKNWKVDNRNIVKNIQELDNFNKKVGVLITDKPLLKVDGRDNFLPDATEKAIEFLSKENSKGFFLIVESACIDKGAHSNDVDVVVEEVIDFDKAVAKALKFADKNGETLVVITADHETGGLSLPQANVEKRKVEGRFFSDDHTGILVPVYSYGPNSEMFTGFIDNTEINKNIMKILKEYHNIR